ncbi:MAG: response regulator [Lachnospiraceae bacterium]|nr:response regulator [Lachnospiraceae bacterium]
MKVLFVDDEPIITQGLRVLIDWEEEGFQIAGSVQNGNEALKFLKRESVDLVLTDIRMPECSGLELLEKVKEQKISEAYFIIMSGFDEFSYAQQALRAGCLDYILKPVDADELLKIVRKVRSLDEARREDEERRNRMEHAYLDRNMITRLIGTYDNGNSAKSVIICKDNLDGLTAAIEENSPEKIEKFVYAFYRETKEKGLSEEEVNFNISYLLFQLIHIASEQDDEVNHEEIMRFIGESSFEESIIKGSAYMCRFCMEYAEYVSQLRKSAARGILQDVEREIKAHYAENISLRELSQKFYLNSAYLGQIFKKKYGQSFKDYLTDYRIKEAARMLARTDLKIIRIAEDVGYKDSDYFVQKFIERMGCTPSKYRRDHREE